MRAERFARNSRTPVSLLARRIRRSPGSTAAEEPQTEESRAQQRKRTGLRSGNGLVNAGEEERIDQPGRIDASDVDIAQPGKYPVERITNRRQEEVVAVFAIGCGTARG